MNEWEKDALQRRLAEQALIKESLADKNGRIQELESEVRYLRNLLNQMLAVPRPQPQPQLQRAGEPAEPGLKPVPQRWKV